MAASSGRGVEHIAGCVLLPHRSHRDVRGLFTKVFTGHSLDENAHPFRIRELFWSRSQKGVVRGMHLQVPPHSTSKLVWVSYGRIRDVILDLRTDSATFGGYLVTELSDTSGAVYVPQGCAHGYEVLSEDAVVNYAQDKDHAPSHDTGVTWNSFGFEWSTGDPILSDRDRALPQMSQFRSPFTMSNSA